MRRRRPSSSAAPQVRPNLLKLLASHHAPPNPGPWVPAHKTGAGLDVSLTGMLTRQGSHASVERCCCRLAASKMVCLWHDVSCLGAEEGLEHLKKQYNLQESFTASYEKVVDEVSEALQATSAANRSALALL